ncbi:hypothetical protein DDE82_006305 [Stemphylium lycopersici]|nr:hypothetical protein DDE82_006305 [Stemphylium lycopersici]
MYSAPKRAQARPGSFRTARRSMRPRSSTATQKDQAQELCIESDERDCTITVCADLFATVGTYLEKAEVTDICKAEEREAHLDSIRYLQSLIEPYSKTRYLAAIKHIRNPQVMEFLHANRHHTPAEILAMFQNGSGRRHEMLVQKFIHMCSPRSHRNLVQLTDASGNASLCYCLRAVAPGDHVIRVRGLAQLLVVGPLQQSQRDHVPVRIVGVSEWNTQTSDSLSGERILATPIKLDVRYRVY